MTTQQVDVLLVGGGVMSATLGTLLSKLDPTLKLMMVERLDHVAHESTDGWNNAGTGHAGYCELNYTAEDANGNVSIDRALTINANFELSLQLWSYLVETGGLPQPTQFINTTPHISFVWGEKNVAFLRQRAEKLSAHHLFKDMEYSEDPEVLKQWIPLVMNGRDANEKVAATRIAYGSDVDFGSLTRNLVQQLEQQDNFNLLVNHEVVDFERHQQEKRWTVALRDRQSGKTKTVNTGFVFLGAGGGSLPLLQASGIEEAEGYGGFPVSGQWLVCKDKKIVSQHHAKVYGKAAIGAPPMSVPHLDTRIINGEPALLFGPYAGFTTKFLKAGSKLDLIKSVSTNNLFPMMSVGIHNMDLTKYLISEVMQSHDNRVETLRGYFPECQSSDWTLAHAGQRVQVIKKDANGKGKLEFGTELVSAADGSLAALLGASPGASVAAYAMLEVLEKCFADKMTGAWQDRLKTMIPSYGQSLIEDSELLERVRQRTLSTLELKP
ncbi:MULTISPECIES: malate dehydrogenase (quinone) [unclassified Oceanobacter]|jgi:malate dehydrogenase (quinone)|uniref:malate dehydrogenase (quinone) n=1 Tax=unclassified Oceanobacter TaxID=2620260 RepID=UPI002732FABB|nr:MULTISPECIES: malate dehydrogenase (quinone) [unclassified Oceanobacter]MDP2506243.1 malate dehydrogenase (quinone) [Oceanobacter sp. 3_MG-2023]MDP2546495.1 malate dehydrogenase (quinone) [Oceanobacter sp. 4_MG-2023]MDP2609825.1 malate dehydrogenase (quinone) [Oceanobacter sp. 1_MG-2023]MDP2613155.1 malate dehydrogenase (quinone) [Oceanobacter sp. 2_MG-2023]